MFNVGDKIVYPMHGAGTIDAIEEKNILGENQAYYIIKMPGEVKVMVPTSKAEEIGVRNIIDVETASKVFKVLETNSTEMSLNWNKRYRDNMEKMKSGDIYEIADVVRNLSFAQVGTFRMRGCRDFSGPLYLHHSEQGINPLFIAATVYRQTYSKSSSFLIFLRGLIFITEAMIIMTAIVSWLKVLIMLQKPMSPL